MHANPLQRERSASLKFKGKNTLSLPIPAPCRAEAGCEASFEKRSAQNPASLENTGMQKEFFHGRDQRERKDGEVVFCADQPFHDGKAAKSANEAVPAPRPAARKTGIWRKTDKKRALFAPDFVYSGYLTEGPENHILPVAQANT